MGIDVRAATMLLASSPLAIIGTAVSPAKLANSRLLVLDKTAFIPTAIWPTHQARTIHLTIPPLAFVDPAVPESVNAFTFHCIFNKVSIIHVAVSREKDTLAMLLSILVITKEFRAILPCLSSAAMLHVFGPLTL